MLPEDSINFIESLDINMNETKNKRTSIGMATHRIES